LDGTQEGKTRTATETDDVCELKENVATVIRHPCEYFV